MNSDDFLLNEFFDYELFNYGIKDDLSPRTKKICIKKNIGKNKIKKNYCSQCKMYYYEFLNHCCFCKKNTNPKNIHCCICNRTIKNNLIHCNNCHVIYQPTQNHCCKCKFTSGGIKNLRHCNICHTVVDYYDLTNHYISFHI